MARLRTGEKDQIRTRIYQIVRRHYNGIRQQEIAQSLKMESRTVNNYLRDLEKSKKIYRESPLWFAK